MGGVGSRESFDGSAGAAVREARAALGLTQEQLANLLGVSFTTVSRWESGRSVPRQRLLEAIARLGRDGSAAPGAPLPERRPEPSNPFFGRGDELVAIAALLPHNRVVTVTGPAGAGKTRLVREFVRARWNGPSWTVELAGISDELAVAPAVAAAAGARLTLARTPVASLAEALSDVSGLLVLDNCEHLVSACATLADVIASSCPGLRILATSREPLRVDAETVMRIGLLPVPAEDTPEAVEAADASRLFIDRAARRSAGFRADRANAAAIAEICRRLDGLPLAIELAAARVGLLGLEDLRAGLDERLELLTAGSRTAPDRHQTLRAALDSSYSLLSAADRIVFEQIGIFAGRFMLDAAQRVCGDRVVAAAVARLVERSLIQLEDGAEGGRHLMLDSIRVFARERLGLRGGTETVAARHAAFYVRLGTQSGAPPEERMLGELDDLRQALRHLIACGDARALDLLGATIRLFVYHGHVAEGERWLDLALTRMGTADPASTCHALVAAGTAALAASRLTSAKERFEQALAIAEEQLGGDEDGRITAALALIEHYLGDYEGAIGRFDAAAAQARKAGSRAREAQATLGRAWSELHAGGALRAAASIAVARALFEGTDELPAYATMLDAYEGDIAYMRRDLPGARGLYERARGHASARSEAYWSFVVSSRLALLDAEDGRAEESLRSFVNLASERPAETAGIGGLAFVFMLIVPVSLTLDPQVTAELIGAWEQARAAHGFAVPTVWMPGYEEARERCLVALGKAGLAAGVARGAEMGLDEATAAALAAGRAHLERTPRVGADVLSPREGEVLALAASGATNKEIALRLGLSPRTVERHLANLYARIGARGRADAIVWALRR